MGPKHQTVSIGRVKTPTVMQMEAVECGAAALGIVLSHFGKYVPLEELRITCGVSRNGCSAFNIIKAAERFGLSATGYRADIHELNGEMLPLILYWEFNHFVVLEGIKGETVFINDPATGPRRISLESFDRAYTGIAIAFEKSPIFKKDEKKQSTIHSLVQRMEGTSKGLFFVFSISLAMVLPNLIAPFFAQIFVDEILINGMASWVLPLLWGMALVICLKGCLNLLKLHYVTKLEIGLSTSESARFFWHLLNLPIQFFSHRLSGDLAHRVKLNDSLSKLITGHIFMAGIDLGSIVFYFVVMSIINYQLALVSLLFSLINLLLLYSISQKRKDENLRIRQEEGYLLGIGMSGLQAIETIKAMGGEDRFFEKWSGLHTKRINSEQRLGRLTAQLMTHSAILAGLNWIVILILGGFRVIDGTLSMGMLVAFQSLSTSFLKPVNNLVVFGRELQDIAGDITRLDDVFAQKVDPVNLIESSPDCAVDKGDVDISDVTFGYSLAESPIVHSVDMRIRPGQRIALVGHTGSGKSTLARLLAGIYQPWKGTIEIDGNQLSTIPRIILSRHLAMVDQDINLFEGTVRNNLTLFNDKISEENMIQAAKDALIHDEILKRKGGYDGLVSEGATNFSGGQRQRLEIARALAPNPKILILDEAFSSLDAEMEHKIESNITNRGCGCLLIAHRLSTIKKCDEIIVMHAGRIVQRGTHQELMAASETYQQLVQSG